MCGLSSGKYLKCRSISRRTKIVVRSGPAERMIQLFGTGRKVKNSNNKKAGQPIKKEGKREKVPSGRLRDKGLPFLVRRDCSSYHRLVKADRLHSGFPNTGHGSRACVCSSPKNFFKHYAQKKHKREGDRPTPFDQFKSEESVIQTLF